MNQSDPNQCQMVLPKMKAPLMEMKIELSARDAGEGAMAFSQSFETEQSYEVLFSFYNIKIFRFFYLFTNRENEIPSVAHSPMLEIT